MSPEKFKNEIENCRNYYRNFENIIWLVDSLYQFRYELIANTDNFNFDKQHHIPFTSTDAEHNFKKETATVVPNDMIISLTELTNIVEHALKQVKAKSDSQKLADDLNDWSQNLNTILSYYHKYIQITDIKKLINDMGQQMPEKRDFTNLILFFSLSTLMKLYDVRKNTADLNTNSWINGHCPICFHEPHYGLIRAEDGKKVMECWLCGIQWEFPRLQCPYCENENQDQLGFFTLSANDLCRVYFCNNCSSYHKVFDSRKTGSQLLLEIHNIASLSHDLYAEAEGFRAGSGFSWINDGDLTHI